MGNSDLAALSAAESAVSRPCSLPSPNPQTRTQRPKPLTAPQSEQGRFCRKTFGGFFGGVGEVLIWGTFFLAKYSVCLLQLILIVKISVHL